MKTKLLFRTLLLASILVLVTLMPSYGQTFKNKNNIFSKDRQKLLSDQDTFLLGMGCINDVSISPDGKNMAVAGGSGRIHIWDIDKSEIVKTFYKKIGYIVKVVYSRDGSMIACASKDEIVIFDTKTGNIVKDYHNFDSLTFYINDFTFSPDGNKIILGGYNHVLIFDLQKETIIKNVTLSDDEDVNNVSFSPDGKILAISSEYTTDNFEQKNYIILYDAGNYDSLRSFVDDVWSLSYVSFSPDSKYITVISGGNGIKLWDVQTGSRTKIIAENVMFYQNQCIPNFNPDGSLIATSYGIWDINKDSIKMDFKDFNWDIWTVGFSNDGKLVYTQSCDQKIRFWDLNTGNVIKTLPGYNKFVASIDYSPGGKNLVSGGTFSLDVWDINKKITHKNLIEQHFNLINSVAYSSEGSMMASAHWDGSIILWNTNNWDSIKTINKSAYPGGHYDYQSIAFSNDGSLLAGTGGFDSTIYIWEINSGNLIRTIKYNNYFTRVAFVPNYNYLSECSDGTIKIWDTKTGNLIKIYSDSLSQIRSFAFSPTGDTIVYFSYKEFYSKHPDSLGNFKTISILNLLDLNTGNLINELCDTSYIDSGGDLFVFSKDGNKVACGESSSFGNNDFISLWDIKLGKRIKIFDDINYGLKTIAFSPDSRYLASGAQDGTIIIRDLSKIVDVDEPNENLDDINNIFLYPNPSSGKFNIKLASPDYGKFRIMIYDILGNNIYVNEFDKLGNEASFNIDLKGSGTGTYFYKLISPNAVVNTGKFFIMQ
ncbi:MAG: T9SS type A sorting domain-containing protein [FCB group bacterium]